jgi:tRNA nucleotidyltransferase (CCA-adding enzyme)
MIKASEQLKSLDHIFKNEGYGLWFVGGCVRDDLLGIKPKDIDLCTDATPDQQIDIYNRSDIKFLPTGLKHGTVTIILDQVYEITTLRTESDHDGRHAAVAYTKSLEEDLSRRDLTINAIAQDFDGRVIDYFGGKQDLMDGVVRFVGNASERMKEDYLRILRFFRFHKRFDKTLGINMNALVGIIDNKEGLKQISAERIWSEMKQILVGERAGNTIYEMNELCVLDAIGMPYDSKPEISVAMANERGVKSPVSILGFTLTCEQLEALAKRWKWSNSERDQALWISRNMSKSSLEELQWMLVNDVDRYWVYDIARVWNPTALNHIMQWDVPTFPVKGGDVIKAGVQVGPDVKDALNRLKIEWHNSDYQLNKDQLIALLD